MKKGKTKKMEDFSEVHLDIPEDEIWSYQVEGLAKPHIGKTPKNYTLKKIVFAVVILVAISLATYFSLLTLQKDVFEYDSENGKYTFSKFSNNGYIEKLDIDFVFEVVYDRANPDPKTNFKVKKDESKKVTEVGAYVLNCDEKVKVINIGPDVLKIDNKAFYSCWALKEIRVDENNPNYCDIDGVLYTKDKKRIICRPCDHDTFLAEMSGWAVYDDNGYRIEPNEEKQCFEMPDKTTKPFPKGKTYDDYVDEVLTYVVPSSVEIIGELSFNYSNMKNVYLPEGLKTIETLGFYEIPLLENVYSYKSNDVTSAVFTSKEALGEIYLSLPEGLETIGSDAFTQNRAMTYFYIPSSVKTIGHHAFWDTVYKEDGELKGVAVMNVASSQADFEKNTEIGSNWLPQYDHMLFKKNIDVSYGATREEVK